MIFPYKGFDVYFENVRFAHGALSLSGQLKIAVAGATNVYAVGGAPGSRKEAHRPAASWLSR